MSIDKYRLLLAGCILFLVVTSASISQAQTGSYTLTWLSLQNGGQSSGGDYHMNSLIGAPISGIQSGAGYQLVLEPAASLSGNVVTPVPVLGDSFEADNTCNQAGTIAVNGVSQEHTLHERGDEDWISFDAIKDAEYRIEVQIPSGSPANVVLDTYKECSQTTLGPTWDNPNTPGARLTIHSPITGKVYIQAVNREITVAGSHVRYLISVKKKEVSPVVGALILVAGRFKSDDVLQPNIAQVANNVYSLFEHQGYISDTIQYLTTANRQNSGDPYLAKYDAPATLQELENAITNWAKTRVDVNRTLTIYLVDHGYRDTFYLDNINNQILTPTLLNNWLTQLENSVPGVKINVFIEACKSGSFVKVLSKPNRIIITSTNADKDAKTSDTGAHFSDQLLSGLRQGSNLYTSFQIARESARAFLSEQDAWIDADGNGIPNETNDGVIAAQRGFGIATSLDDELNLWPPYISAVQLVGEVSGGSGIISATITDNSVVTSTWVEIIPPSAISPPDTSRELVPAHALLMHAVTGTTGQYQLTYTDFAEAGTYQIIVYAEDDDGLTSSPYSLTVQSNGQNASNEVFLPLVTR